MKETKLHESFLALADSLNVIAKELPKEIKKMEGTVSDVELRKVSDALNNVGFEEKVKEMDKARQELKQMVKDVT
jgi:Mn-dependent DtxR family transcriptional regulator